MVAGMYAELIYYTAKGEHWGPRHFEPRQFVEVFEVAVSDSGKDFGKAKSISEIQNLMRPVWGRERIFGAPKIVATKVGDSILEQKDVDQSRIVTSVEAPRPAGRRKAIRSTERKQFAYRILDTTFGSPSNQRKGFVTEEQSARSAANILTSRMNIKYTTAVELVLNWYRH